jgi:CBS domain containing-hemolysin-like protein
MTPIEKVYMLEINVKLDKNLMREIYEKGFSRIPIYKNNRENIVGCLHARDLILLNTEKKELSLK